MSVNRVILLGNVGKDPEVKEFSDGGKVANFSLATTERAFKLQNGTEIPEKTEWHNLTVKGGLAKVAEQYVKKGTKLYIEGKIKTRSYDDENGVKRYITEIYADQLELLGGKPPHQEEYTYSKLENQVSDRAKEFAQANAPSEDDDLPF